MIRFRRWSRKGYAMFCSLGKCVTIGNLKKGIADASLNKQANTCVAFVCPFAREDDAEKQGDEGLAPSEFMLQLLAIESLQPKVADKYSFSKTNNLRFWAERVRDASFRLFYFLK